MAFLCQADLPLDKVGGGRVHSWHRLPVLKPVQYQRRVVTQAWSSGQTRWPLSVH